MNDARLIGPEPDVRGLNLLVALFFYRHDSPHTPRDGTADPNSESERGDVSWRHAPVFTV